MIEQPWSSIVFEHPRWQYLERRLGHLLHYVECDMGVYTLDLVKKSVLVGTAPYLSNLGKAITPEGRRIVLENPKKKKTATKYIDKDGKPRSQGGPDLKGTENDSMSFGAAHAL